MTFVSDCVIVGSSFTYHLGSRINLGVLRTAWDGAPFLTGLRCCGPGAGVGETYTTGGARKGAFPNQCAIDLLTGGQKRNVQIFADGTVVLTGTVNRSDAVDVMKILQTYWPSHPIVLRYHLAQSRLLLPIMEGKTSVTGLRKWYREHQQQWSAMCIILAAVADDDMQLAMVSEFWKIIQRSGNPVERARAAALMAQKRVVQWAFKVNEWWQLYCDEVMPSALSDLPEWFVFLIRQSWQWVLGVGGDVIEAAAPLTWSGRLLPQLQEETFRLTNLYARGTFQAPVDLIWLEERLRTVGGMITQGVMAKGVTAHWPRPVRCGASPSNMDSTSTRGEVAACFHTQSYTVTGSAREEDLVIFVNHLRSVLINAPPPSASPLKVSVSLSQRLDQNPTRFPELVFHKGVLYVQRRLLAIPPRLEPTTPARAESMSANARASATNEGIAANGAYRGLSGDSI